MGKLSRLTGVLLAAFLAAAPTSAASSAGEKPLVMRLAHINAETDPKHQEALKFKDLVEKKTNGQVKIEVYGGGVLGDVREIIEGLQIGTNEIVIEGFGTIPSYTKLSLLDLVPFLYRDRAHFDNMWKGDVGREILAKSGEDAKMLLFGPSYRGVRVTTSVKRFTNIQELKGLKIRVPADDMSVKTWQALGARPTPMPMGEVLTGIQQGTVEAQENPPILSYNFGLADACKYLIKTNHRWSADVFMMDRAYFEKLPTDVQEAVLDAGREAADFTSQLNTDGEEGSFRKWAEAGAEIIVPELEGFRNATVNVVQDNFPDLLPWVEKIKAIQ
ncbi:MAG: TRAP transporter substrate-binding protein [Desulfovibrio sp.]|jgi:tripartite ATP-independent transporter DctP family solute receptor|nr:TRAP transporter substrate-binding protein [Desulfovibrio sp.]